MNECILELRNLTKSYDNKMVVDHVNLKVNKGDIFGFLGPNGAGKTTTIRMILNLIKKDQGTVLIDGIDTADDFKQCISKVGTIVESPKFYDYLTGYENLKQVANLHQDINDDRIHDVLTLVKMNNRAKDKVSTYSLGMKQRLGLARALLNNPALIILDEPTNGLDPQGMKEIRELIETLAIEENITFLISTHFLHEVEQICNKVAILKNGKIITQGQVQTLLNKDSEIIKLVTDDFEKTIQVLKRQLFIKSITKNDDSLLVEIDKNSSYKINKILLDQNIRLKYLIPSNQSLEEFFIEQTKGGDQIA